ncbi:MAG: diaminopimelate epimerase [Acidobacteriota bacterium]
MTRWAGVSFTKVSGGGNDFILVEGGSSLRGDSAAEMARLLCARGRAVGADGLIVVEPATEPGVHLRLKYFNADGSRAFCGNSTLCVARWAHQVKGLPARLKLATDEGSVQAWVRGSRVQVDAPPVRGWRDGISLAPAGLEGRGTYLEVGCPHLVVRCGRPPDDAEFFERAAPLRRHPDLLPGGANVDFITVLDSHGLKIRTFERGVEAETLASGTGCLAASLAAAAYGEVVSPVTCRPRGGEEIVVRFRRAGDLFTDLSLEGSAHLVYTGVLGPAAFSVGRGRSQDGR